MGKKIDITATEQAQLTSEGVSSDLAYLKANGARALPDSPTAAGWSADAIKKQLYKQAEILFAWLQKLAQSQLSLANGVDDFLEELSTTKDFGRVFNSIADAQAELEAGNIKEGTVVLISDGSDFSVYYSDGSGLSQVGQSLSAILAAISGHSTEIAAIQALFSSGKAKKAIGDGNGDEIAATYAKIANIREYVHSAWQLELAGKADLDSSGHIPAAQLPGYVDDIRVLSKPIATYGIILKRSDLTIGNIHNQNKNSEIMGQSFTMPWTTLVSKIGSDAATGLEGKVFIVFIDDENEAYPGVKAVRPHFATRWSSWSPVSGYTYYLEVDAATDIKASVLSFDKDAIYISSDNLEYRIAMYSSLYVYVDSGTGSTHFYDRVENTFAVVSKSIGLGETSSTAFPGNRGKALEDTVSALGTDMTAAQGAISDLGDSIAAAQGAINALPDLGFERIPAPTSSGTTQYCILTDDEVAKIIKGAVVISGEVCGHTNVVFFPAHDFGSEYAGMFVGTISENYINAYRIIKETKRLEMGSTAPGQGWTKRRPNIHYTANVFGIDGLTQFNGKSVPNFPSDTTKPYSLEQGVGGNLAWNEKYDYGFRVIDPPASETLTEAEVSAIMNGVKINGTFLNFVNPVFFPGHQIHPVAKMGFVEGVHNSAKMFLSLYTIDNDNHIYIARDLIEFTRGTFAIAINRVNLAWDKDAISLYRKTLPQFPSDTTKPYKLTQEETSGDLAWVEDVDPLDVPEIASAVALSTAIGTNEIVGVAGWDE